MPSALMASSSLSFALSRAAWADAAASKLRRAAASPTSFSARLTADFNSSIVGKSTRLLMRSSNFDWSEGQSVKAFLDTASSSKDWTSAILNSRTVLVRGRLCSRASFSGIKLFSMSAAVLKSFVLTATSNLATSPW